MDFAKLREALRTAREHVATERRGRARVGLTLDEAAAKSGLNRATIHSIENVRREPTLKPELETIERLTSAYGLTLSTFFATIDGSADVVRDMVSLAPQVADHESIPALPPEDGIAAAAVRRLTERIDTLERRLAARARVRPANHQHAAAARATAAEVRRAHRSGGGGHARRRRKK